MAEHNRSTVEVALLLEAHSSETVATVKQAIAEDAHNDVHDSVCDALETLMDTIRWRPEVDFSTMHTFGVNWDHIGSWWVTYVVTGDINHEVYL